MNAFSIRCLPLVFAISIFPTRGFCETSSALAALNQGRADDAIRMLTTELATAPKDALARQLLCRAFYSIEQEDAAIQDCNAAVADDPSSSANYLWLGRAYGLKAGHANPIAAFRLARQVVAAFERSVSLDPGNKAALSDLGEFYVAAPSIVGGGLDKAQQLASRILPVSATKAHRLLALIAEKKGDMMTAEAEFKKAVEAQPSPSSYVDLGAFYQRQKKEDASMAAIQTAIHLDHAKDASLVDAASVVTDVGRSPQLAQQLLAAYLASSTKTDDQPASRVHVQLGNLLLKSGDQTSARREFQAAITLASSYAPARKALQALSAGKVQ